MILLAFILFLSLGVYTVYVLFFLAGLLRLKQAEDNDKLELPFVSVIVAARNEEKFLPALLKDLSKQDYPKDKIEFLIVDDRSTDDTWTIITKHEQTDKRFKGLQIRAVNPHLVSKKNALTQAIDKARGEIIITTDADCRVPDTWVYSMQNHFNSETGAVVGYSRVAKGDGSLFARYQQVDFLALMSANAGSLGWGRVVSGSGQNMAFRKNLFNKVGGYQDISDNPSGDDVFLIVQIGKLAAVRFNSDHRSFVDTHPSPGIGSFISQRMRWSFDVGILIKFNPFPLVFLGSAFVFNLILLMNLLFPALRTVPVFTVFIFKALLDSLVIGLGAHRLKTLVSLPALLAWTLIQPFYIPFIGIAGRIGKFRWKN